MMPNGLYYKHVTIVNYASSGFNKLRASHNDDARVVIYDPHMFIVQATDQTYLILLHCRLFFGCLFCSVLVQML